MQRKMQLLRFNVVKWGILGSYAAKYVFDGILLKNKSCDLMLFNR